MATIEKVLSRENQEAALAHFASKRGCRGPDGMHTNDLPSYWRANGDRICAELKGGCYQMGVVRFFERMDGKGKRRPIASINATDRLVERMLFQALQEEIEPILAEGCFAFRQGKGPLAAEMAARQHIEDGYAWLCEVDVKDYFDEIGHGELLRLLNDYLDDEAIRELVRSTIARFVEDKGRISRKGKGLVQGASASPLLSNLYLHPLDEWLEGCHLRWMRFADNIYVFAKTETEAAACFNLISRELMRRFNLVPNARKSGVFKALDRRILGYELRRADSGSIDVRRHCFQPKVPYGNWHRSTAFEVSGEYHIVQNGILNKKDYSLLFENEDEKHHIPVEVADQINIYGDVLVSPQALGTLSERGIRLSFFDKYGNLEGTYTPAVHRGAAGLFLKQCCLYSDSERRLELARRMQLAAMGTMRANLQYYRRSKRGALLDEAMESISRMIEDAKGVGSIDELMLVEARARQAYYSAFDDIVAGTGFVFESRTKRPPRNELNAMISLGNTLLYNRFLQKIWKTPLDPKVGIVHATNRRDCSLNLDLADLFKPVVVDRTIFTLINRRQIKTDLHFTHGDDGSVLLNKAGKRMLIGAFESKLRSSTKRRGGDCTYARLLADEVDAIRGLLEKDAAYKPYKYY